MASETTQKLIIWIMGASLTILIAVVGFLIQQISIVNAKTESNYKELSDKIQIQQERTGQLSTDISVVKTDVGWIRSRMEESLK